MLYLTFFLNDSTKEKQKPQSRNEREAQSLDPANPALGTARLQYLNILRARSPIFYPIERERALLLSE
jgi:hypothetical protein